MSSLIVQICRIDRIESHPNADRMEVAVVKGWRTCVSKGQYREGDLCVYVPPDSVIPSALAERIGVKNYLSALPKDLDGNRPDGGRVRVARLRGERSYGLILKPADPSWTVGQDVAAALGITKWEPPQPCTDGDAERPHPAFHRYTDIENYRNFPGVIKDGEEVAFTEKLHGKNARLGLIRDVGPDGEPLFCFMVGSHDVNRKEFTTLRKMVKGASGEPLLDEAGDKVYREETRRSQFWDCLTGEVRSLLSAVSGGQHNVIVFGEMIGQGIQDMTYGAQFGFLAFDISVNGRYLNFDEKQELFDAHGVPSVPVLYRGPFCREKVEEFVDGPTTMCPADKAGPFKGREGIVVTSVRERTDFDLGGDGRVILKAVSFAYLERKDGTEDH